MVKNAALAFLRHFRDAARGQLARWHRRIVSTPVYIGITGSAGKSTAKELLAGILSTKGACAKSLYSGNEHREVELAVLQTTRKHRFSIVELSAGRPGYLERSLRAVRPTIGVLTLIAREHYSAFRSLDAIAAEKEKLILALPRDGIAVLNRDDPLIRTIGERFAGKKLWVGRAEGATLRLLNARSCWPDPLVLDVIHESRRYEIRTSLYGAHLALPVLSALGAALAAGVPLSEAIEALALLQPMQGRMQVERTRDGVIFVRDDWKAPQWSFACPLEFMRTARAKRKVVVIGSISDSSRSPRDRYAWATRQAFEVAELVVLVGPSAETAVKPDRIPANRKLLVHPTLREAAMALRDELRTGDLVLIKGTHKQDHLVRLVLDRDQPVHCWETACGLARFCGSCDRLHVQRRFVDPEIGTVRARSFAPTIDYPAPVLVGVGNPGATYAGTRHNVGQRMLDMLITDTEATWHEVGGGVAAVIRLDERPFTLYKPGDYVNRSGLALQRFLESAGRLASECVIVLDDTDLPLGTVRRRAGGGDGGHRGMRSVIATFGTERIRRIRMGVRPAASSSPAMDFVLTTFDRNEEDVLARAMPVFRDAIQAEAAEIEVSRATPDQTLPK